MKSFLVLLLLILMVGCASKPLPKPPRVIEETVEYRSDQEPARGFLCRPATRSPWPAMILVHEDHGLTGWVKEQARRLAEKGYLVLAVDLYRGQVVTDVMDAHIMDRALPEERVIGDLKQAVQYLLNRPDLRGGDVGIMGWDSGAGYALDAAIHDPRLRAVVVCYGRLTTDPALLAPLQAPVLGIFAGKDEGISPETIAQFTAAMKKAGKRLAVVHVYPQAGHGFMNPATPEVGQPSTSETVADAWNRIDAFLRQELKP